MVILVLGFILNLILILFKTSLSDIKILFSKKGSLDIIQIFNIRNFNHSMKINIRITSKNIFKSFLFPNLKKLWKNKANN